MSVASIWCHPGDTARGWDGGAMGQVPGKPHHSFGGTQDPHSQ